MDPDQTAPIGAVCSGSTLFASIHNPSEMLGSYLQQTTSADDIFRCIFFCALRVKPVLSGHSKIDKTKVLMTNGSAMKVKSNAEFCNILDLH